MKRLRALLNFLSDFCFSISSLNRQDRYVGFRIEKYDCALYCFGFWWFHFYLVENSPRNYWRLVADIRNHKRALKMLVELDEASRLFILLHPDETIRNLLK